MQHNLAPLSLSRPLQRSYLSRHQLMFYCIRHDSLRESLYYLIIIIFAIKRMFTIIA